MLQGNMGNLLLSVIKVIPSKPNRAKGEIHMRSNNLILFSKRVGLALFVFLYATSCSVEPRKLYTGPDLPISRISELDFDYRVTLSGMTATSHQSGYLPYSNTVTLVRPRLRLLPGSYLLLVGYNWADNSSPKPLRFDVTLKPGKGYKVIPDPKLLPNRFRPLLIEVPIQP